MSQHRHPTVSISIRARSYIHAFLCCPDAVLLPGVGNTVFACEYTPSAPRKAASPAVCTRNARNRIQTADSPLAAVSSQSSRMYHASSLPVLHTLVSDRKAYKSAQRIVDVLMSLVLRRNNGIEL